VGEPIDIVATIEDDVHVESAQLSWREVGASTYTTVAMSTSQFMLYEANIGPFSEVLDLEYHITAYDAENHTVWPAVGQDALLPVVDDTPPVIEHQPIQNLTLNELPIVVATVTDDVEVASVIVYFSNATSDGYADAPMLPVSGNQSQYAALLGKQPIGEFSYHIEASDGYNTVSYPVNGDVTVQVTGPPSNYWSVILLGIIIVLLVAAAGLIIMHRRKSIKSEDDTSQQGKEDA
jgi:hypothetical protein